MDLSECQRLTISLLKAHGLVGENRMPFENWSFKFDRSLSRFGSCDYTHKVITLSRHLVSINDWSEVELTVLHEIAHAKTPGNHHGEAWQFCYQGLLNQYGRTNAPTRTYDHAESGRNVNKIDRAWVAYCPTCQKDCGTYHRRRNLIHKICRTKIEYRKAVIDETKETS